MSQANRSIPKTKIVCTIGPASASPDIIRGLIYEGMSVARLNFSHGTHSEHGDMIEKAAEEALESGYVSKGDIVVITAGYPTYEAGTTNMMRVKRI
jgi:pyruvate kinase